MCETESRSVTSDSLQPHGLYSPWNSPGQNTGVGSRSLLQGIFPTQGSNPGLLHCRRVLYQLSHQVSPRILEWVSPFSSGSSWPESLQLSYQGSPYICVCVCVCVYIYKYIYIYIFWLCWVFCYCTQAFSRCSEQRLLIAEHRL